MAFCEIEKFPRAVLKKHWPDVPCHEDIRNLKGEDVGPVDVICGGYPCQPFSLAGKRAGAEDDRHLWPEFSRLVDELRPAWVIGENVAGHIGMGLDEVLSDLEGKGYTSRPFVIPACAVDAPHRRDRVWIVAHPARVQQGRQDERPIGERVGPGCQSEPMADAQGIGSRAGLCQDRSQQDGDIIANGGGDVANAQRFGQSGQGKFVNAVDPTTEENGQAVEFIDGGLGKERVTEPGMGGMDDGISRWLDGDMKWPGEPDIGRVAVGVKNRVNRLKALGNTVVPQIPEMIGRAILEAERAA